ncbi:MAG: BrnT family toxin [Myxococcales bacterium]|nr:BrnT family toxin [Myxococcales bacterium]
MATVIAGSFEWAEDKERAKIAVHGVAFAEAATVFAGPMAVYLDDGSAMEKLAVIGTSLRERLLFVVHVARETRDRIISARRAETGEREVYGSGGK